MGGRNILFLTAAAAAATIPSAVAAQSGQRCAAERDLYSDGNTGDRAWIVIVNRAPYPVRVFWIDRNGNRVPYKVLQTGQNFRSYSYSSHAWVVTDLAGNCRQVYFTETDDRTYEFDAPDSRRRYDPDPYDTPDRSRRQEADPYDGPDTVEPLTERDANQQVDVQVGQEMTIALPSNTSTGYSWQAAFANNVSILGPITEERPDNAQYGGGGTSLVRFRIQRRGPAQITLMYVPPGGGTARRMLTYRFRGI